MMERIRLSLCGAFLATIIVHILGFRDNTPWPWIAAAIGAILTFYLLRTSRHDVRSF